jgi:aquaporin Z
MRRSGQFIPQRLREYSDGPPPFTAVQAAITSAVAPHGASLALETHWPEYLIEGVALGAFMISACLVTALLEHPASPVRQALPDPVLRRVLAGIAMGLTAVAIICSPWGKRSGAHMNPALTLTFLTLGKVAPWDAVFYMLAQFAGGLAGVLASAAILGPWIRHASVNYAITVPGSRGPWTAFWAECAISFLLMTTVLAVSNSARTARFTPWVAGFLVASFISVEAPLSGMSMNPARTVASAWPAGNWTALWVYFLAPPAAMLFAGYVYRLRRGAHRVFCAKLHHHNDERCIFRCNYGQTGRTELPRHA